MPELPRDDLRRRIRAVQSEQRCPRSGRRLPRGELVWSEAAGLANVEEERPASVDDQFRIGSITKTFVAVAILQLRDEGALALDDPVEQHVEEVPHSGATIRRLLAHASGLQREPSGTCGRRSKLPDRDEFLASLGETEQVLAPGLAWHYSNLAFILLGDVVGRLRGELRRRRSSAPCCGRRARADELAAARPARAGLPRRAVARRRPPRAPRRARRTRLPRPALEHRRRPRALGRLPQRGRIPRCWRRRRSRRCTRFRRWRTRSGGAAGGSALRSCAPATGSSAATAARCRGSSPR